MSDNFLLSGSRKAMLQFQIALDMIPKIKPTRHRSEFQQDSIIQARKCINVNDERGHLFNQVIF